MYRGIDKYIVLILSQTADKNPFRGTARCKNRAKREEKKTYFFRSLLLWMFKRRAAVELQEINK